MALKKEWFKKLPGGTPGKPLVDFGRLLPRKMGIRSFGMIWSSSLFPGPAPEGWELLLTYIGGARDPSIKDMTEEEIYKQVDADYHKILLKDNVPERKKMVSVFGKRPFPSTKRVSTIFYKPWLRMK